MCGLAGPGSDIKDSEQDERNARRLDLICATTRWHSGDASLFVAIRIMPLETTFV